MAVQKENIFVGTDDLFARACRKCVAVPKLVTGLKAWHMREGFEFLTVSNLRTCMESIPARGDGTKGTALFVCGEIDCRSVHPIYGSAIYFWPNILSRAKKEGKHRPKIDVHGAVCRACLAIGDY